MNNYDGDKDCVTDAYMIMIWWWWYGDDYDDDDV